jgi:hypothetical protein
MSAVIALACFGALSDARADEGLAHAVTGITYFNRPGATLEEHQAALERCAPAVRTMNEPNMLLLSGGANYNAAYSPAANVGAALILMAVDAARVSAAMQRAQNTHYQNCMVAQGWRVVRLEDATGRRLSRMGQAQLAEQLAPLIAAAEPQGVVARTFSNELAHTLAVTPLSTGGGRFISLSRLALPTGSAAALPRRTPHRMPSQRTREESEAVRAEQQRQREIEEERSRADVVANSAVQTDKDANAPSDGASETEAAAPGGNTSTESAALAPAAPSGPAADPNAPKPSDGLVPVTDLAALPQDATIIVFRQRGAVGGVMFRRIDGVEQESFTIGTMRPAPRPAFNARTAEPPSLEDTMIVMVVPPGHWRMESMLVGDQVVSLCLGSPAFDLSAGEVVYMGDFNFGADPFGPDLTLTPAQQALTAAPPFAARLRAASYANGSSGACRPSNYFYAYQIPEAAPATTQPTATPAN